MKIVFLILFLSIAVGAETAFSPQAWLTGSDSLAMSRFAPPPPIDQVQKLSAIDARGGDSFGSGVSISGDTAVIGANNAMVGQTAFQGAAYVYHRTNGQWTFAQRLIWGDGGYGDGFGSAVAVRGDTIMIGAPHAQVQGSTHQGRVIVYRRTGGTWLFSQAITPSDGAQGDLFGLFVAISGETAMIGSYRDDIGANADQGSVYVFTRAHDGWFQRQKLTAPDGAPSDTFGNVSLSGETAVVGSFQADIGTSTNQGAVYVFRKSGASWVYAQKLTGSDSVESDWFGYTAHVYGGTIVASSFNVDIGPIYNQGASYIFTKSDDTWTERQKITVVDDAATARGFLVRTLNSDTIVAHALRTQTGSGYNQGVSYVFARSGGVWTFQQRVVPSDGNGDDGFGYGAEIFGSTIIYGAIFADLTPPGNTNEGAAYLFEKSPAVAATASITGRVLAPNGRPAYPASVTIEDSYGDLRWAHTNPFGYYRFKDVPAGSENTLRVVKKKAVYGSRTTVVEGSVTGFDFAALP